MMKMMKMMMMMARRKRRSLVAVLFLLLRCEGTPERLIYQFGKVGSTFVLESYASVGMGGQHIRDMERLRQRFGSDEAVRCRRLPTVVHTHKYDVAAAVLACSPEVLVWSQVRAFEERSYSAFWENRGALAPRVPRTDAPQMAAVFEAWLEDHLSGGRVNQLQTFDDICHFLHGLARLVGVPFDALHYDDAQRRVWLPRNKTLGDAAATNATATHALLVTRFEDIALWPAALADVDRRWRPKPSPPKAQAVNSASLEYQAFKALAQPIARKHTDDFRRCDSALLYPNTTVGRGR